MSNQVWVRDNEPRKKADKVQVESWSEVLAKAIGTGGDIVKELTRAAMVNPLLGLVLGLVISDILEKGGVIYKETGYLIKGIITSSAGVELTGEILNLLTSILPFSPSKNPQPELFKPSVTTLVFAEGKNGDLSPSLLAALGGRK